MNPVILYKNILADGTLTATSTKTDYDVDNLVDYRPYTLWRADGIASEEIEVELVVEDSADCLGIMNHNLFTIGATITVQYYDGGWQTAATFTASSDKALMEYFTSQTSDNWRVVISGHSVEPQIGIIFLGTRITFPIPPDAPYNVRSEGIVAKSEVSKTGMLLGSDVRYFPLTIQPVFQDLTRAWVYAYFIPFYNNHGRHIRPFFYGWDLDNAPDDVFYVRINPDSTNSLTLARGLYVENLQLDLLGAAE